LQLSSCSVTGGKDRAKLTVQPPNPRAALLQLAPRRARLASLLERRQLLTHERLNLALPRRARRALRPLPAAHPSPSTAPTVIGAHSDSRRKPFSYSELRLRIGAVLRRTRARLNRGRLRIGELEIDPASRVATLRGRRVALAAKEFALLRALAREPTRVFTKEDLLLEIWGYKDRGATRTLDSHACRVRQKLAREGDRFVVNVWGIGYRLIDGPVEEAAA
jgi:DNA-binding winged helix-turn-helix (wHTH) protein